MDYLDQEIENHSFSAVEAIVADFKDDLKSATEGIERENSRAINFALTLRGSGTTIEDNLSMRLSEVDKDLENRERIHSEVRQRERESLRKERERQETSISAAEDELNEYKRKYSKKLSDCCSSIFDLEEQVRSIEEDLLGATPGDHGISELAAEQRNLLSQKEKLRLEKSNIERPLQRGEESLATLRESVERIGIQIEESIKLEAEEANSEIKDATSEKHKIRNEHKENFESLVAFGSLNVSALKLRKPELKLEKYLGIFSKRFRTAKLQAEERLLTARISDRKNLEGDGRSEASHKLEIKEKATSKCNQIYEDWLSNQMIRVEQAQEFLNEGHTRGLTGSAKSLETIDSTDEMEVL